MSSPSINRSVNGCLTCKKRKKKCDETRPACMRCINADFECLGYDYLAIRKGPRRRKKVPTESHLSSSTSGLPPDNFFAPTLPCPATHHPHHQSSAHESSIMSFIQLNNMAKIPQINSYEPDHIIQMFLHYSQLGPAGVKPFTPFSFSLPHALASRVKGSNILLKSMHVGTRIKMAVLDGAGLTLGVRLIDDFQRQITNTALTPDPNPADAAGYMNCLFSLVISSMQIINIPIGYVLLQKLIPFFLALAAKSQELWTDDLSLSIQHAFARPEFEISHFVFFDTVTALVLGTAPLIRYDTTLHPMVQPPERLHIDWAHGCSHIVITLLAKVNSWRAARLIDPMHPTPSLEQQIEFQAYLREWNPRITYHDGDYPAGAMGRLAVQEIWRHSVLIYMHMGMCGADSANPQVEASVLQIVKLSATIEKSHPFEAHITVPCIVAATAARKEKHRAILRKKIVVSRDEQVCLIRGADFVLVFDHLWHGAASGGCPTTWQDYVNSRFVVLPVET
ncbi:unnamed protein product [Rhizoctonia solani]|uniref:Zn(2)-C6 fungal-type domain-containing protein n=1 Tax=Rhizoctonia solani TaxID=456999 RepID=A0A8H3BXD4_9AGAM|nr:unnamed protein product [Rhizoctonia solani]